MVENCGQEENCCKSLEVSKKKKVSRRLGANQIPDEILNNKVLNDAIAKLLPKNYNFEIHKTIFKVNTFINHVKKTFYLVEIKRSKKKVFGTTSEKRKTSKSIYFFKQLYFYC